MRLEYDEVDDAVLDPSTARLEGDILTVSGSVRAGYVARELAPSTNRRDLVPLVLRIGPVRSWSFANLNRGTGELLAGRFTADDAGGRVEGVIPGDLLVSSPRRPSAWFETVDAAWAGPQPVRPVPGPVMFRLTPARRAGVLFYALGAASGLLAFIAFLGFMSGLARWDGNWDAPLEVVVGRGTLLVLHFQHAWHYLLPVLVALGLGSVGFIGGIMAAINPKRS